MVAGMWVLKSQLSYVKKLLRFRGKTREDAEDLVQEAVLRLHAYMQDGREVHDHKAFVIRTAMNLAVDAHRHAHTHLYESTPLEDLHLPDFSPTPDEELAAEQRLNEMRDVLDRVSVRTREIFFLHRLHGFSHAEIAQQLGISKSAIEKHIATAVTTLALERARQRKGR
jgi:RNA polymerase sigma-70 factor (ECF subfamily)